MRIYCDFDGTISRRDSTDFILEALADPDWRRLQVEWEAGRISADVCMRGQVALIGGSDAELDELLDTIELDPGFAAFAEWAEMRRFPLGIVSDGVDYFIARILSRHGLQRLPVIANHLVGSAGRRRLEHPPKPVDCASGSGVCKCQATAGASGASPLVFVGDGRSDYCVAARADVLFAKGALAVHIAGRGQSYHPFDTFRDVLRTLERVAGDGLPPRLSAACG
jgi:2,3-diketo-5-methylthio-1-phosphopentane phosphatase